MNIIGSIFGAAKAPMFEDALDEAKFKELGNLTPPAGFKLALTYTFGCFEIEISRPGRLGSRIVKATAYTPLEELVGDIEREAKALDR
jgi:hypothetical protein